MFFEPHGLTKLYQRIYISIIRTHPEIELHRGYDTYDKTQLRFQHCIVESSCIPIGTARIKEKSGSTSKLTPFPSIGIDNELNKIVHI
jgi:hypothetical protein